MRVKASCSLFSDSLAGFDFAQFTGSGVYPETTVLRQSTPVFQVTDNPTDGRLGNRLDTGLYAGAVESWSDGGLVRPRVFGAVVNDKPGNKRIDDTLTPVNWGAVSRGQR